MRGLFITLEGGEGAGKSTQAHLLAERLAERGFPVASLAEPGGTPLGDHLRTWLKSAQRALTPEAELLLFTAARAELVRTVLRPQLEAGTTIVLDRYADSTTAYQGAGRGLPAAAVRSANHVATGGLTPDLTILLDGPLEALLERARSRGEPNGAERFEREPLAFHRRVARAFRGLARREAERFLVVDATRPVPAVAEAIWAKVSGMLPR